jgi:uncharacterized protein (DUF2235 family)
MARKIILLSDGTGNSAAKVWRTNVWRTYEALDLSGSEQVAFYDDGVGTSSFKPLAVLGGAFGYGLKRNVIALYKFACRNYLGADDQLFGFGFSRGAFTIRIVMGLIANQGLVQATSEPQLEQLAQAAYRAYRKERYKNLRLERPWLFIRNLFGPRYDKANNLEVQRIHFIGVWDTVSAYGMPIKEMADGIHRFLWPIELPDNSLSEKVVTARQALALDEERTTFHPQLWAAPATPDGATATPRHIAGEPLCQVWFSGVHSNVGGGYPDDSLAYIPFVWMIEEAKRCGLTFKSDYANDPNFPDAARADPDTFKNARPKRDKDGRSYDPRKGLGGYYRYGPRKLVPTFYPEGRKAESDEVTVQRARIHESVFERLRSHARAYAPVGVPPLYDVVRNDGTIATPDQYGFETNIEAAARAQAQEHVWNGIWRRRCIYFLTVGATIWLVIFPFVSAAQRVDEYTSPWRWVSDLVRLAGVFLPGFASTWINGYARAPLTFVVMVLVLIGLLWAGARCARDCADMMDAIWQRRDGAPAGLPRDWIYKFRSSAISKWLLVFWSRRFAPALSAVAIVYVGIAVFSHMAYNIQDVRGWTCDDTTTDASLPTPRPLDVAKESEADKHAVVVFNTSDLCKATGILIEGGGARYYVKVEPISPWMDGPILVPEGGFSAKEPPPWYYRVILTLGIPLRRELTRDWFRLVLRYGRIGGEEDFIDPDPTDPLIQTNIKPTRAGELFIFVNDAVIGVPGLYGLFYKHNAGSSKLTVYRTR